MPMKYEISIEINKSLEAVIKAFDNADNLKRWQPTLESVTFISGVPGEVGAETKLVYNEGKGVIELVEKITENRLPDYFAATYYSKTTTTYNKNWFESKEDNVTLWTIHTEIVFNGFLKFLAPLMKKHMKKTSEQFLTNFKIFAEGRVHKS